MVEEAVEERVRRRPVKRLIAGALLLLLLVLLAILWSQRMPIAADYIDRELARRGVQATYEVKRIGFRTQRLENLVIGDPKRPDLTARWVEVDLSWGLRRPRVGMIRARGVRLFGRVVGGKLSLGQVDRLLPPPTGLPFRLPDQAVDVADASIRLDTPAGRIGLALEGKGNLADGFRGRLAAASRTLSVSDCRLAEPAGSWAVAVDDLRPALDGPVAAAAIACGADFALARPRADLVARFAPALDRWDGRLGLAADSLRFGSTGMAGLRGKLGFTGDAADTRGRIALAAERGRVESLVAGRSTIEGSYAMSARTGRFTLAGNAAAGEVTGGEGLLGPVR